MSKNTTKLKAVLLKYSVTFDMSDDEIFTATLIDKTTGVGTELQADSYTHIINKIYYYMKAELRKEEEMLRNSLKG